MYLLCKRFLLHYTSEAAGRWSGLTIGFAAAAVALGAVVGWVTPPARFAAARHAYCVDCSFRGHYRGLARPRGLTGWPDGGLCRRRDWTALSS